MSSVLGTYARKNISFSKGKGCYLYDLKGEQYLDFASGIAVNSLGHCHEHLVKIIQEQSKKLWHVSNMFVIPEQEKLAKRLTDYTFADFVCFQNSGSEATEASIKIARKYFHTIGQPNRKRIITFKGAFHGRTLAALFAANNPKHIEGFDPKVDGFDQVPFADLESLKKAITNETAGIMIETILGEGGIKEVPDYCLKGLRKLCDEKNLLLILDEVQCGIGRTGDFFAFENSGIVPDIAPIAKGIGGGFPLGACLLTKKVSVGMTPGTHGSTFGGNPLAMAVGNGVLDIILQDGFLDNVKKISKYFDQELIGLKKKYSKVILEVRGRGLLKGLKLAVDNTKFIETLMRYKMLVVKAEEQVIRLFPALIVSKKEIDEAISKINETCKEMS
ncbi:MAG: aspartate aminotransferase family protein [Pelagibacteraceae bacterium]|jgi:acetylornithine/N-succinyldiaminopimelate aminotransferase|nr:aspartate aminotransferase family protein [Pelagibacteraceae bacterium]|tara:strand:- start:14582 stop:15748 length:1167 start_codon:yes stop_codon:yes gene_type:complete